MRIMLLFLMIYNGYFANHFDKIIHIKRFQLALDEVISDKKLMEQLNEKYFN